MVVPYVTRVTMVSSKCSIMRYKVPKDSYPAIYWYKFKPISSFAGDIIRNRTLYHFHKIIVETNGMTHCFHDLVYTFCICVCISV